MWPVEFWLNAKWAPFFTAGGVFYLVRTQGVTLFRLVLLGASFALAQVYAAPHGPLQGAPAGQIFVPVVVVASIVTAIFGLFWLIAIGRFRMKASRFIYYAGALTYPMYVVHQNLGFMIYGRLHETSGLVIASLAVMMAVLLLISWGIHAYVERPLSQAMRHWLARPRHRDTAPRPSPGPGTPPAIG